jgi:hypothetical protein
VLMELPYLGEKANVSRTAAAATYTGVRELGIDALQAPVDHDIVQLELAAADGVQKQQHDSLLKFTRWSGLAMLLAVRS